MANLLVKAKNPGADGLALSVTPESAGWKYVGFQVYRRAADQELDWSVSGRESCLVLLSGKAKASIDGKAPVEIGDMLHAITLGLFRRANRIVADN